MMFANTSTKTITIPRGRKLCLYEPLDINDHGVFVSKEISIKLAKKSDNSAKRSMDDVDQTTPTTPNIMTALKTTTRHDGDASYIDPPEPILMGIREAVAPPINSRQPDTKEDKQLLNPARRGHLDGDKATGRDTTTTHQEKDHHDQRTENDTVRATAPSLRQPECENTQRRSSTDHHKLQPESESLQRRSSTDHHELLHESENLQQRSSTDPHVLRNARCQSLCTKGIEDNSSLSPKEKHIHSNDAQVCASSRSPLNQKRQAALLANSTKGVQTHADKHLLVLNMDNTILTGLCKSDALLTELCALPDPDSFKSVPDYFNGHELSLDKLPPHLKGLNIKLEESHLRKEEVNLLIHYCCVDPIGRDKLFTDSNTPGACEDFKVIVDIADKTPWSSRLFPCSPADQIEIGKLVQTYLDQGLIEYCHGPYSCAVILVRKSSGRHKIACCLNNLNLRSRKNSYPVPLIQDNLDSLCNRKFITALDICGGYLSMLINPEDRDYFAFITAFGLFRWKRVPYGWRNAGANFCYLMDQVLIGLKYQIVVSYIDDIICFGGRTFNEHLRCIRLVMNRIQDKGMTLAVSKCSFCLRVFDYLGFQISREGVRPNLSNVEKITHCKIESTTDARQFVGLCQFYRRWIPRFSQLVTPLYDTLKIKWSERDVKAVSSSIKVIKEVLSSYPVLRHPNFDKEFFLSTDGSLEGFGAILQ
jgi:hypothetical protein